MEKNSPKNSPQRALVVIGVQNEYFDGRMQLPQDVCAKALKNILRTMHMAKEMKIPVIVVSHEAPAGSPTLAVGSRGAMLHEQVAKFPFDHHFVKKLPSAFAKTDLLEIVRGYGVDTITLAGFVAQNGIIATAIEARCLGFSGEFVSDASASLPQSNSAGRASGGEIHRTICVALQASFAATMTTDRWSDVVMSGEKPKRAGLYCSYDLAVGMD